MGAVEPLRRWRAVGSGLLSLPVAAPSSSYTGAADGWPRWLSDLVRPRAPAAPWVRRAARTERRNQTRSRSYNLLDRVLLVRYLGMDPIEDCAFLWIAEQALVAPLPDDWSEHMDGEGV